MLKFIAIALTLVLSNTALAADKCRTKAIEAAEDKFGEDVEAVKAVRTTPGIYRVTLRAGKEKQAFDVIYPNDPSCAHNPIAIARPSDEELKDPSGRKPAICHSKMAGPHHHLPKICFE